MLWCLLPINETLELMQELHNNIPFDIEKHHIAQGGYISGRGSTPLKDVPFESPAGEWSS